MTVTTVGYIVFACLASYLIGGVVGAPRPAYTPARVADLDELDLARAVGVLDEGAK